MKKISKADKRVVMSGVKALVALILLYVIQAYLLGGRFLGNMIVETPVLYCTIIWCFFAVFSGHFEAYYYEHEVKSSFKDNYNEHPLFVAIRLCVFIPLWILTQWKTAAALFIIFPFFHDGQYYLNRNNLSGIYPRRWFDQSKTSTAFSTKFLTPLVRTLLAFLGFTLIIIQLANG